MIGLSLVYVISTFVIYFMICKVNTFLKGFGAHLFHTVYWFQVLLFDISLSSATV